MAIPFATPTLASKILQWEESWSPPLSPHDPPVYRSAGMVPPSACAWSALGSCKLQQNLLYLEKYSVTS